ncbi:hypothetical protein M493_14755 [Geobacillus genomosp. 3]|uniref:Transposase n=1 Tax=Geobacillus genomosp. 3 TaxID=1921421 RepID=S5Z2C2_GEOG3|nr:hypothetical protein M493_14755 [Geobacillus genomosp. 3]
MGGRLSGEWERKRKNGLRSPFWKQGKTRRLAPIPAVTAKRIKKFGDEVSQMETKEAKQVMELIISYEQRGIEKGIQQGVKQGIKQGIEQGRQKGIEEGKIDIAKKMLAKGYDVGTIHELTGLPAEKIEQLKK